MPHYVSPQSGSETLRSARRILVVGNSAGGKSTLSRQIAAQFDLPYISMDRDIRWLSGWIVRDRQEQRRLTEGFAAADAWVMDGTTVSSFDIRGPRADLVIWMRTHRLRAMWQLTKRVWSSYGKTREDMADGCPEQLPDREFLGWIWTFEKKQSPRLIAAIDEFAPKALPLTIESRGIPRGLIL